MVLFMAGANFVAGLSFLLEGSWGLGLGGLAMAAALLWIERWDRMNHPTKFRGGSA